MRLIIIIINIIIALTQELSHSLLKGSHHMKAIHVFYLQFNFLYNFVSTITKEAYHVSVLNVHRSIKLSSHIKWAHLSYSKNKKGDV